MYPAPFEYTVARSFEDAVALLMEHGPDARLLAGGQSLLPMMNLRLARPSVLIDLNPLASNAAPTVTDNMLRIPALTRQRALERAALIRDHAPLLAAAARHVGNVRVRSRGTVGGNLAHGEPSSELSAAAVALGASVVVLGPTGERTVRADDAARQSGPITVAVCTDPVDRYQCGHDAPRRDRGPHRA